MIKVQSDALVKAQLDATAANRVDTLKEKSASGLKSEKELDKAAGGFEALLLQQMLKSMWETVETTGLMGEDSNAASIYRDMFNQAVADEVSEGRGIGVKSYLKQELRKLDKHPKDEG